MYRHRETIAALATPVGTAAIALLRVSGDETSRVTKEIFGSTPPPRLARHGDYTDLNGMLLDDVVFTFFQGPRSYTGEDSLEISCHGNPFIAQKILEDLLARGCRSALPGEFTQRAFLNGRMDLNQAESVMDLIHARSERALAAANGQLRGSLRRKMEVLTDGLLDVLARVEAYIDFPEEDLPPEDRSLVRTRLEQTLVETNRLLAGSRYGEILREGLRTVILGEPNAGKSSLLNRLVGHERALVSPEAGTTRDFIEERLMVGPHCLRLVDTAGLNPDAGKVERMGIEKTLEQADEADLLLLVLDANRPAPEFSERIMARIKNGPTLLIWNKVDLTPPSPADTLRFDGMPVYHVSALTGAGLDGLVAAITDAADAFSVRNGDEVVAIGARHAEALVRGGDTIRELCREMDRAPELPLELIASGIRDILGHLGEITGRYDNEAMLDRLFSTFCIGK